MPALGESSLRSARLENTLFSKEACISGEAKMYRDADGALKRILELVETCPEELQAKCFEILLAGYVQAQATRPTERSDARADSRTTAQKTETSSPKESDIPTAVLPRFKNTAKRIGVGVEKLESLFDFGVDPFALHAVTLPGGN